MCESSLLNCGLIPLEFHFLDTTELQDRKDLKKFVKDATGTNEKKLQAKNLVPGSPMIMVVSGAALRIADVVR